MGIEQRREGTMNYRILNVVSGKYRCFLHIISLHFHKTFEVVDLSQFLDGTTRPRVDESFAQHCKAGKKYNQNLSLRLLIPVSLFHFLF